MPTQRRETVERRRREASSTTWPATWEQTRNDDGRWVPSIPLPLYWTVGRLGLRQCQCGRLYWTTVGYRGHYALRHILKLGKS